MNSDGGEETKWPLYGGKGGRYRYRMYAIVDPEASPEDPSTKGDCARYLQKLGYGENDSEELRISFMI